MPVSVTMPQLGESVTEGTVTRWLKREGDQVTADEPLLEVATDKVDTEIPAPATGVLSRIVVEVDQTVAVGAELAIIEGQAAPPESAEQPEPAEQPTPPEPAEQPTPPEPTEQPTPPEPTPRRPEPAGAPDAIPVTMPALGESVTEGTVTRWLKAVGDQVTADEPLLEVATDKVDTEIPAPASGVLLEIRIPEDGIAEVGAVVALLGPAAGGALGGVPEPGTAGGAPSEPARPSTPSEPARPSTPSEPARPGTGEIGVGYLTPLVRKLAAEHGVSLAGLTGTGQGGRITRQDVLDAAERTSARGTAEPSRSRPPAAAIGPRPTPAAEPGGTQRVPAAGEPGGLRGRTEKLSRMRAVIARRMVESLQTSAQLTTVVEVDVTGVARLRDRTKADFLRVHGVKLTFLPFFALATVEALRIHPVVNASIDPDAGTVTYHAAEHLALAVDTEKGLMVPVIRDAGDLSLAGLARRIADLAARTRAGDLSPDDVSGGTFTLTNTGSRGALLDTPIINQPQVGILGTGTVVKRAVVVDDPDLGEVIVPRSMVYLSLSYDHRLVDGADAARFLGTVKRRLEDGAFERDLGLT